MLDATIRLRTTTPRTIELPPDEQPRQLGDYRLLREIGRGGMGIVYEAEQQSLDRRVALKVMAGPTRWDRQARERFEREARSAAQLHHTNIVPVFDVGMAGDDCFYAMQYIDGIGLDRLLSLWGGETETNPPCVAAELTSPEHPEHFRALARVAIQAADGLAHAHVRGVIHRDIKPANLLLDTTGVVWITDFGLAKQLDDNLTRPGDVLGTIRYMAPERFHGSGDARADIYALGVTLYELVTRKPAYPHITGPDQVAGLDVEPVRPSTIVRRVPRDLETIILKAMDKDPARRYATAQELADDLRRFVADEPIRARPIGPLRRTARWARRRPLLASLTGSVVALAVTVIIGAIAAAVTFHDLAHDAHQASQRASEKARLAVEANASAQEIANLMLGVLDETDPLAPSGRVFGGHGGARKEELKPVQVLERTLAKLEASPEIAPKARGKLLDKIGAIFVSVGQSERGEQLLQQALGLRRAEHGDHSAEAAETWHNLGLAYLTHRSYEQAEAAHRQALAIREQLYGNDHPLVTLTIMHLGIVKAFSQDAKGAAVFLRRAQASLRDHGGDGSRQYAMVITVLAMVLLNEGQIDEARPLLPEALMLIEKHEGPTELGRSVGAFMQARFAAKIGLASQAAQGYRDAVQLAQRALGREHFLVVLARNELATHLLQIQDLTGAEAEYRAVLQLCEKSFGAQSGQAAAAKMHLARALRNQKRYAEAEALLLEASDQMRSRQHSALGRCLHIYWEVCYKQGKVSQSLPTIYEAVQERKKSGDLSWYSHTAYNLALTLSDLGKRDEAARAMGEANRHLARQPALPPQVQWLLACRCAYECELRRQLVDHERETDEAVQIAIEALRGILKARSRSLRDIEQEATFRILRDHLAFQQMLAEARR